MQLNHFFYIIRIKEMIGTLMSSDCETNSPCQYPRKCIENSMENMLTDVKLGFNYLAR